MAVVTSCREVLGLVPQRPQPSSLIASTKLGPLGILPVSHRRKVGRTSSPHRSYLFGYPPSTMAGTKGSKGARWSKYQKAGLRSDWSLQLDSMKLESLVIANQQAAVNTFPGLVHTARHTTGVDCT